jgi:Domain of unknown function (DUF6048)
VKQSILSLFYSALFCLIINCAFAQQKDTSVIEADTVTRERPKKPDSLKEKFYPRAFRIGTDLIAIGKTQFNDTYSGWEGNVEVDCGYYYPNVEVGHWGRSYDLHYGDYGHYENSGNYYRVGMDINILRKDPDRNTLFFGVRYGHSSFSESATLNVDGGDFGTAQKILHNSAVTAGWGEITSGLRVKIWKEFWLGYTARMKFLPSVKGDTELKSFDIPGYGMNGSGFYWGFNYQIFYRIPLKKKK